MESKTTVVVGLGRSGNGAAKLLQRVGNKVIVIDSSAGNQSILERAKGLQQKNISVVLGKPLELKSFQPWLKDLSCVVISPTIPWNHSTLNELRKFGITIKGEISLAWEHLRDVPWIGVTGTNGKTTVTNMLQHVLQKNQIYSQMGGNVGYAATEIALEFKTEKNLPNWLIMELSSYQLEGAPEIKPKIGIWTNLTQDHIERHGSLENYNKIKKRMLDNSEIRIYNADDKLLHNQRRELKSGIWISSKRRASAENLDYWIEDGGNIIHRGEKLFNSSILKMKGEHNLQNLLLVTAAANEIGISGDKIANSIATFSGVPHRLEDIGKVLGMKIFNDSKATNYESSIMAIKAVSRPTVLIAGGRKKAGSISQWIREVEEKVVGVVLFGESSKELKASIETSNFQGDLTECETLEEGVTIAINIGQRNNAKSILFSPACASFDQYENYEARGVHFQSLIKDYQSKLIAH